MNNMPNKLTEKIKEIEEGFDISYNEKYEPMMGCCGGDYCKNSKEHNKSILAYLHSSSHSLIQTVIEMAEGMKKDVATKMIHIKTTGINKSNRLKARRKAEDYNQALTEIIISLKESITPPLA